MSFNFNELLLQGKSAAEDVIQNRKEIKSVISELQNSLSSFLEMPIRLVERIEYIQNDSDIMTKLSFQIKPKEKTGFNLIYIVNEDVDLSKEVFKIKRSDDVYPVTIVRDRNHSVADDKSEFASALGQIASSSQFHLQLNAFKREVEEKLLEKLERLPGSE